MYFFKTQLIRG